MKAFCLLIRAGSIIGMVAALLASAQTVVPTRPFHSIELIGEGRVVLKYGAERQVRMLKGGMKHTSFVVDSAQPRKLLIRACDLNCPERYTLEVEVVTPAINAVAVSGGGSIESRETLRARINSQSPSWVEVESMCVP